MQALTDCPQGLGAARALSARRAPSSGARAGFARASVRTRAAVRSRVSCSALPPRVNAVASFDALEAHATKDARGLQVSPLGAECVKIEIARQVESSNKQPQKPYTIEDWERHKSNTRWQRHLFALPGSGNGRNVLVPVTGSILLTTGVGIYSTVGPDFGLPPLVNIGLPAVGIITSCLSFLLVFRTNNSYGRFDEARKLWGGLVNRSRDLNRQVAVYFPRTVEGQAAVRAVARWQNAHNHCLRAFCDPRRGVDLMPMMKEWLAPAEYAALEKAAHRPGFCMHMIGELIHQNVKDKDEALRIDENVRYFEDVVGACERIFRTPIPVAYTRHTSRFLSLWALLVPFALWHDFKWSALLFAPMLTFLLFAIEEIGVQLEEPYSMLPLAQICETIRGNTQEIAHRFREDCRPLADELYTSKGAVSVNGAAQPAAVAEATAAVAAAAANGNGAPANGAPAPAGGIIWWARKGPSTETATNSKN